MSDHCDLFQTAPPTHASEATVTAPQDLHPLDDASQSAPSAASQHEHPSDAQFSAQPNPLVEFSPPYADEDDEDDFNVCAPRPPTDRSMLYPVRHGTPQGYAPSAFSVSSSATNTPLASRTASPQPFDYSGASSCDSDSDSEPDAHLLPRALRRREGHGRHRRWWSLSFGSADGRRYRRWRDAIWGMRTCRRVARRCVRHPLFPKTPVTIVRVSAPAPAIRVPCTPHPPIARRGHRPARVCAQMLRRARSARCVLRASVHGTPPLYQTHSFER